MVEFHIKTAEFEQLQAKKIQHLTEFLPNTNKQTKKDMQETQ